MVGCKSFQWYALVLVSGLAFGASAAPITEYVTIDGQHWAQPDDFTLLTWNDINAVCPGGVCSGSLISGSTTFEMDGWTFASVNDVNALFNVFIGDSASVPTGFPLVGPSFLSEIDSTWAPQFLTMFNPTRVNNDSRSVAGWTTTFRADPAGDSYRLGAIVNAPDLSSDIANTAASAFPTASTSGIGAWFFRTDPTTVPIPGTLILIALGLVGLYSARRE